MTRQHDPLDQLIREALGEPANPAPARRACRAALRLVADQERRRARRRLNQLTMAASLAMVCVLAGPLGSDGFDKKVEISFKNGHEIRKYTQGLRGDEMGTYGPDHPQGLSEAEVDRLYQEQAAGQSTPVALAGWQLGRKRHFVILADIWSGEEWRVDEIQVDGYGKDLPGWLNKFVTEPVAGEPRSIGRQIMEIADGRAPDLVVPMFVNRLEWIVSGWQIELPGHKAIIYYSGVRADGERGH